MTFLWEESINRSDRVLRERCGGWREGRVGPPARQLFRSTGREFPHAARVPASLRKLSRPSVDRRELKHELKLDSVQGEISKRGLDYPGFNFIL